MKVVFGGVRGARPVTDPGFSAFGGETTSVLVVGSQGEQALLDAGSGLARLEPLLVPSEMPILMAFSHFHLDHLIGLPFLRALNDPDRTIAMVGPRGLDRALHGLVCPPFWPHRLDDYPAKLEFPDTTDRALALGGLDIRLCPVSHPGGAMAYRIDDTGDGSSLIFAPDIEWAGMEATLLDYFLDLGAHPGPADLLIMDGYLHPQDTAEAAGRGHSSYFEGVEVARRIGATRLVVTHHHPAHDDETLETMEAEMKEHISSLDAPVEGSFAWQGLEIDLAG